MRVVQMLKWATPASDMQGQGGVILEWIYWIEKVGEGWEGGSLL